MLMCVGVQMDNRHVEVTHDIMTAMDPCHLRCDPPEPRRTSAAASELSSDYSSTLPIRLPIYGGDPRTAYHKPKKGNYPLFLNPAPNMRNNLEDLWLQLQYSCC